MFCECNVSVTFYRQIERWAAQYNVILPALNVQNVILQDFRCNIQQSLKHMCILLYKLMVFQNRNDKSKNIIQSFQQKIVYIEKIEYKIASNRNKLLLHFKKWSPFSNILNLK